MLGEGDWPIRHFLERYLCPIFLRQRKTPKTSNSCLKNRAFQAFHVFIFGLHKSKTPTSCQPRLEAL